MEAVRQNLGILHQVHMPAVYTLSYLLYHCQLLMATHVVGFNTEAFETLIVNNTTL
jgi:hypothetical protein